MGRYLKKQLLLVAFIFIFVLVVESIFTGPALFIENACAPDREFEEDIAIPSNELQFLELVFSKGDELELIFTVEVEQELPIDVWFVDSVNYVRLVDGNEFLYFIDGSDQEITQASKVVSVTQHGTYVLVLANYNNGTVNVHLSYDLNTYPEEVEEEDSTPLWQEYYVILPLGIAIGLIVGLLISRVIQKSGKKKPKKKPKTPKKKKKPKPKKVEKEEDIEEEPGEPPKKDKKKRRVKKEEPKTEEKVPQPKFCGHCGKPVTTPFCPHCGKEAGKA